MVIAERERAKEMRVVTAFGPVREGYWGKTLGREVWPGGRDDAG